jgi:RND family efflux transporter MFP subunit
MKKIIFILITYLNLANAQNIYATFDVLAKQSANLAFTASGTVEKVFVDIGSIVKKDTPLAKLKNDDVKALLDKSKIILKYAKKELDRQKRVRNLIDANRFDKIEQNYENAKASFAYQQALYEKTILKAPFDGIIYDKAIEVGDAVSGMMLKTIFKIQSLHSRKIVLQFDQKYHDKVKVGQKFIYKIDGDDNNYTGIISKIYPYANANNRKMKAEVEAKDFTVGLFGEGHIITKAQQ